MMSVLLAAFKANAKEHLKKHGGKLKNSLDLLAKSYGFPDFQAFQFVAKKDPNDRRLVLAFLSLIRLEESQIGSCDKLKEHILNTFENIYNPFEGCENISYKTCIESLSLRRVFYVRKSDTYIVAVDCVVKSTAPASDFYHISALIELTSYGPNLQICTPNEWPLFDIDVTSADGRKSIYGDTGNSHIQSLLRYLTVSHAIKSAVLSDN